MGRRNVRREELRRLESKTLEARFDHEIREGLGCSPFEAEAVLQVVREVFYPYMDESAATAPPGRVTLVAVCADEPAGKAIRDCQKRTVSLTVHRGADDDVLLREKGPTAFRRGRLAALCQEALSQGGLLTREDLAYRIFYVSPRTISRDLAALREADPKAVIALRGTVRDIGPLLTHRVEIVRLALDGKTTSEICTITRHSPPAVSNYVATFVRCAQLAERDMQAGQIAFLLRRGKALIGQYLALLATCRADKNRAYHLAEMLRWGEGKKKDGRGREHGRSG